MPQAPDTILHANRQAAIDAIIYYFNFNDQNCKVQDWSGIGSEGALLHAQFPNARIVIVQCSYSELNKNGNSVSRVMTAHAPYNL